MDGAGCAIQQLRIKKILSYSKKASSCQPPHKINVMARYERKLIKPLQVYERRQNAYKWLSTKDIPL